MIFWPTIENRKSNGYTLYTDDKQTTASDNQETNSLSSVYNVYPFDLRFSIVVTGFFDESVLLMPVPKKTILLL
jgi:hypothetical protein